MSIKLKSDKSECGLVESLTHNGLPIALILRSEYSNEGIEFFTPGSYSQQLGYMKRPKGYIIDPHIHLPVPREVLYTNETLFVKKGLLKASFFSKDKEYLGERLLKAGDFLLLIQGGHGFEMLDETELIEIKQGPYSQDLDKERFSAEESGK